MKVRALLDATAMPARRVGVGWYLTHLVEALTRRPEDVELHVLAKRRDASELRERAPSAEIHTAAPRTRPGRLIWEQTGLPLRSRRIGPDVFHGPHYTIPPHMAGAAVVTFHDPTFFTHPELHERSKVAWFGRMARLGVKRASRVIVPSEYARQGAVEHAGASPGSVDVVPHGIDTSVYNPEPGGADAHLRERVGAAAPYVLWVGALEPRKDVPTLVRAFSAVAADRPELRLVLVGPPAWGEAAITEAIARSAFSERVLRTGYVSEAEKIALYRGAAVFCYPSIAEGFGLPVLEAMACGTPVVTTTGSAPEEVGGDAVALVAPKDADALAGQIERVLDDPGGMGPHGVERARMFGWDASATGTLEAYRKAAA